MFLHAFLMSFACPQMSMKRKVEDMVTTMMMLTVPILMLEGSLSLGVKPFSSAIIFPSETGLKHINYRKKTSITIIYHTLFLFLPDFREFSASHTCPSHVLISLLLPSQPGSPWEHSLCLVCDPSSPHWVLRHSCQVDHRLQKAMQG